MIPIVTILTLLDPTGVLTIPVEAYPTEKACGDVIPKAKGYFFPDDPTMRGWSIICEPTKRLSRSPIPPLRASSTIHSR